MDEILLTPNDVSAATQGGIDVTVIAMAIIGVFAAGLLVIMAIVLRKLLTRADLHGMTREEIKTKWQEIERISEQGLMGSKMAIVEADKLLDGALKSLMMPGDTMGERLKVAGYKYPELKRVWFAHKLRNQIVHESSFEISSRQASSAMHEYKKALKVIHVL